MLWTQSQLQDELEQNLLEHFSYAARRHPRMRVQKLLNLTVIDSGLHTDTFNAVCGAHQTVDDVELVLPRVLHHFRSRGLPFSWWVGPTSDAEALAVVFSKRDMQYAEGEVAMALRLNDIADQPAMPDGIRILKADSAPRLQAFAEVNAANWTPPDQAVIDYYETAAPILLAGNSPSHMWVAYEGERAVAAAELFVSGSVGGIYNVSSREDVRGRGIGTAMTWTAIAHARGLGLPYAVLQASAAGVGVYERLGFVSCGSFSEFKLS
jgi:GNAT superfamily N-acetyltransferase